MLNFFLLAELENMSTVMNSKDEAMKSLMEKIFNSEELKNWSHYHKLQNSFLAVLENLEEFKAIRNQLRKRGYDLGHLSAEKFSYSSETSRLPNRKPAIFAISPT